MVFTIMSESQNEKAVLNYVRAFNTGDMETLRSVHTHDAVIKGVLGWGTMEQAIPIWQTLHDAFAIELTVDDVIEAGDTVAVRYTERGRSVGAFRGQGPTGQSYEIVAIEWFQMRGGLIYKRWGARDSGSQMKQLGLNPL